MRRRPSIVAVVAALVVAGCAAPPHIVPDVPEQRYSLRSWPRGSVSLEVVDARSRKDDSEALVEVTRAILLDALATAQAPAGPPRLLQVEILLHDVSLSGPIWIATTRFRATLFDGERALRTWEARSEERRMNALPSGKLSAAQEAYQRALGALMSRMENPPP
jgi:hypothetical protein